MIEWEFRLNCLSKTLRVCRVNILSLNASNDRLIGWLIHPLCQKLVYRSLRITNCDQCFYSMFYLRSLKYYKYTEISQQRRLFTIYMEKPVGRRFVRKLWTITFRIGVYHFHNNPQIQTQTKIGVDPRINRVCQMVSTFFVRIFRLGILHYLSRRLEIFRWANQNCLTIYTPTEISGHFW